MDLAAVFAISLLGGYYCASWWRLTAYATRRYEGHHLYFRAALTGVILFCLAATLRQILLLRAPAYKTIDSTLVQYVQPALKLEDKLSETAQSRRAEWVVTAAYSLVLGLLSPLVLNRFTPKVWAALRSVGTLDKFLLRAQRRNLTVQLTLNNGKIYIGFVRQITDPADQIATIVLTPMFSGYRDDRGRMTLTTDYEEAYSSMAGLAKKDVVEPTLVLRADAILTASPFTPTVYAAFHPDWKGQIALQNKTPPPQEFVVELKHRPRWRGWPGNRDR